MGLRRGGFQSKAEVIAAELDMYVADVESAEPLSERLQKCTLSEDLEELAAQAESNPNAILYDTFHTYPFDTA